MATYTKRILSGSTHGRPIKVAASGTPGTLIHTAIASATDMEEVWLFAQNTRTSDVKVTIEFGGTTDPDDLIEVTIPWEAGLVLVVPGLPLRNSLVVRAFAAVANVVNIMGYVNRIEA